MKNNKRVIVVVKKQQGFTVAVVQRQVLNVYERTGSNKIVIRHVYYMEKYRNK